MTDDGLLAIRERASSASVPIHMHLVETSIRKRTPIVAMAPRRSSIWRSWAFLGAHMTLGHGVWMTEEDIEICAGKGTCVCHNCSSNFRLRSGVLPLMELKKRGVTVGLGMDEAGINDEHDMLQEMRMALTVHRVPGFDPSDVPSPAQVLCMATELGGLTTAFGAEIGRLETGRQMEAVVLDYETATYPVQDPDIAQKLRT